MSSPIFWAWTLTSYLPVIYRWVSKVSHSFPLKHIKTTILRCCFYSIYNIHIHLQMNCPKKNISGTRHTWDSPWPCLTNAAARVRVAPAECGDAGVLHAFPGGSKGGFSSAGGIEVDSTWFNMIQPMTGWWFHTSFIFSIIYGYIWDNPSHWLSYFPRGRSTARSKNRRDLMQKLRNFPDLKHARLWDQLPGGIPPLEG